MYTEYDKQADDFLQETGTKILIRKLGVVQGFPNTDDKLLHDKYSITLKRNGKSYSFKFYNSQNAHDKGERAKPYDVLSSLITYEISDNMWEFAREFGMEINSEKTYNNAKEAWKGCRRQYQKLCEMYTPEEMERLAEIQ